MTAPRLLDLYCGAGGAARGYADAGFDVLGVDIKPQSRYPYPFIQADVLELLAQPGAASDYDVIHASPPCKPYTALRSAPGAKTHPALIPATRALLRASGKPYVIENVEAAAWDMIDPVRYCGTMFGLGVEGFELQRHRLFESNILIIPPHRCWHRWPVIGVYGGHVRNRAAAAGGRGTMDFVGQDKPALAKQAMGIDWMTMKELSDAIPPAYTRHIGAQLIAHLQRRAA
jgi:DNA (cytosine-5)-methyltransferase 1